MSEQTRIVEVITESRASVRDALDILLTRMAESDDEDERRSIQRAVKALYEAMDAIADARHRSDLQKRLTPPVIPMPYPYPVPTTPPWEYPRYPRITWGTSTGDPPPSDTIVVTSDAVM